MKTIGIIGAMPSELADIRNVLSDAVVKTYAGYDFYVIEDVEIPAYGTVMLPTNVKAYMQEDEKYRRERKSTNAKKTNVTIEEVKEAVEGGNGVKISDVTAEYDAIKFQKKELKNDDLNKGVQ